MQTHPATQPRGRDAKICNLMGGSCAVGPATAVDLEYTHADLAHCLDRLCFKTPSRGRSCSLALQRGSSATLAPPPRIILVRHIAPIDVDAVCARITGYAISKKIMRKLQTNAPKNHFAYTGS